MDHNSWRYAGVAIIVAFVVLRGLFRMLKNLGSGGGNQMDRIQQAARRVLQEQQKTGRTSVPVTQQKAGIGTASKAKQRPMRTAATGQKARAAGIALAN